MGSDDKAVLVDLDRGIVGIIIGIDAHTGDKGLVWIRYVPHNSISEKRYMQPVRENAMHPIYPKNRDIHGTPQRIVFVYENTAESLMKNIVDAEKKRNDELERQIDDLRLELAAAQQRAESAQAGTKKLVSEAQEITKSQRPRNPFNPFGGDALGGGNNQFGGGGDEF